MVSRSVLVTGAGGFVGSAVLRLLAERVRDGTAVLWDGSAVERAVGLLRPGGDRSRLAPLDEHAGWRLVEADLLDARATREAIRSVRPAAILHLALESEVHEETSEARRRRLAIAPLDTLVLGLGEGEDRRFVHTGSAWVLGPGEALDETAPVEPEGPYALAKAWEARRLPEVAGDAGVRWINLRLFNIFGRYEPETRLLPYLVQRLSRGLRAELSDGDQVRDFNDVDDMARAYLLALDAPDDAWDRIYHVGSGRGTSVRRFAEMVADVTGHAEKIRYGRRSAPDRHMDRLVADPGLARRRLGWSVAAPLEERVARAARWWLERTGLRQDGAR